VDEGFPSIYQLKGKLQDEFKERKKKKKKGTHHWTRSLLTG